MVRDYIFVSYAHTDGKWLDRLRIFLDGFPWGRSYLEGGHLWADPQLRTGDRWRREIGDGLARARVGVLLISKEFLASKFIREHELPQLLDGARTDEVVLVCVPVKSAPVELACPELLEYQWVRPANKPLDLLSAARREAALTEVVKALFEVAERVGLTKATATVAPIPTRRTAPARSLPLTGLGTVPGKLFGAPSQPPHFIPLPGVRDRLRTALLGGATGSAAIAAPSQVGVFGPGGIGKTVSIMDLVHDPAVQRAFPDGIYWLELGQTPDLLGLQARLLERLTGAPEAIDSVAGGIDRIREELADRGCLVVLDNVWRYDHAAAFDAAGAKSRLLVTTRDAGVLTALGADAIELSVLGEGDALELVAAWAGRSADKLPDEAKALVKRCGYLPLAISIAGALIRDGTSWDDLLAALEAGNLRLLDHQYASVFASLRLSIDALPEPVRSRYLELAVIPKGVAVPVSVISRYWALTGGLAGYESRHLLADLAAKCLLYKDEAGGTEAIRLHDLQRDFLQLAADDTVELHRRLLDSLGQDLEPATRPNLRAWWTLKPDQQYVWHNLGRHLLEADCADELMALLLDYEWIVAKLAATDLNSLVSDYELVAGEPAHDLVRGALALSHVLAKDKQQLAGQLTGRLLSAEDPRIAALVKEARTSTKTPWLRPLTGSLAQPGGALVYTLDGLSEFVVKMALTAEGRRAVCTVSGSSTLEVWDLVAGELLQRLIGHSQMAMSVAVTPDGRLAVAGATDGTVRVWDLASSRLVLTIDGQSGQVDGVAVTPDGRRVVAGLASGDVKVWEITTGRLVMRLAGHSARVGCVAVAPDGRLAVSGSWDKTIKVWDLATGGLVHTLTGHSELIDCLTVTPDSRLAISASMDRTLKVWDLSTGAPLQTLQGHSDPVAGVAVTPDGRRVISGSGDATIKIWDLETGEILQTLYGHAARITDVAVAPDGRRAISASADRTIKIWDLAANLPVQVSQGHSERVTGVAVTPDGLRAISGSSDCSVKVWDVATGDLIQTLDRYSDRVRCVAVAPDGRRAVSGSWDKTVQVWDLATGGLLQTFAGHAKTVTGVAITPDGERVISASADRTLKIWELGTGKLLQTLQGHSGTVTSVAVTQGGLRAISGSEDETVKVWDLGTGALLDTLKGHSNFVAAVAALSAGERAVSGSLDWTVKVWDLAGGKLLQTLEGHADLVASVAIAPDGRRAISASADRSVKVWDLETAGAAVTFTTENPMQCCAVARDGVTIVAGDLAGRVHFLRLENV
ncbi:MAG: NB-ARC domain-containing protein [Gemmatimonadota bacterium]